MLSTRRTTLYSTEISYADGRRHRMEPNILQMNYNDLVNGGEWSRMSFRVRAFKFLTVFVIGVRDLALSTRFCVFPVCSGFSRIDTAGKSAKPNDGSASQFKSLAILPPHCDVIKLENCPVQHGTSHSRKYSLYNCARPHPF